MAKNENGFIDLGREEEFPVSPCDSKKDGGGECEKKMSYPSLHIYRLPVDPGLPSGDFTALVKFHKKGSGYNEDEEGKKRYECQLDAKAIKVVSEDGSSAPKKKDKSVTEAIADEASAMLSREYDE